MDAKTAAALEDSIAHWKRNVEAERPEQVLMGSDQCALCLLFHGERGCVGCPVMTRSGCHGCRTTPYHKALDRHILWDHQPCDLAAASAFREAARAELAFLESLCEPTEETP